MNKFAMGGIAIGAGALLLLGGGGTFALWNDAANLNGGSVNSGQLKLDTTGYEGNWYHFDSAAHTVAAYEAETPIDTSTYTIVPQDKLVFIGSGLGLTAEGGNLSFTVAVDTTGIAQSGFTVDTTFLGGLQEEGTPVLPTPTSGGVYTINASNQTIDATLDAAVLVSFDASGTADQNLTLDLSSAQVKVQQVTGS